jgi:hypothetical protein
MEYRTVRPAEHGFTNETEQSFAQRDSIQQTMNWSGPDELLDSLLVITNVCEQRALIDPAGHWYRLLAGMLRCTLEVMTKRGAPRPDASLENPELYFPDMENIH